MEDKCLGVLLEMVKKIKCRVIASAFLGDRNVAKNEIFTADNLIVNNFPKPFESEMLTYTDCSGTLKVNYHNSHTGKLLDLLF